MSERAPLSSRLLGVRDTRPIELNDITSLNEYLLFCADEGNHPQSCVQAAYEVSRFVPHGSSFVFLYPTYKYLYPRVGSLKEKFLIMVSGVLVPPKWKFHTLVRTKEQVIDPMLIQPNLDLLDLQMYFEQTFTNLNSPFYVEVQTDKRNIFYDLAYIQRERPYFVPEFFAGELLKFQLS